MSHKSLLHSPRCTTHNPCSSVEIDSAIRTDVRQSTASAIARTFSMSVQSPPLEPVLHRLAFSVWAKFFPNSPDLPKWLPTWTTPRRMQHHDCPSVLRHWLRWLQCQSTTLENLRRYDVYTLNLLATIKPVDLLFRGLDRPESAIATVDCSSRPTFVVVDGALGWICAKCLGAAISESSHTPLCAAGGQ